MSNPTLPPLDRQASKYTRGMVVVVAGSARFPGAAVLAVGGARRGGAGYVRLVCSEPLVRQLVLQRFPDVVVGDSLEPDLLRSAAAFVVGCGTTADDTTVQAALHHCLGTDAPVVIDAGMLDWLANDPVTAQQVRTRRAPVVITPHAGEARRMANGSALSTQAGATEHVDVTGVEAASDEASRVRAAVDLAHRYNAVTVLKGPGTVVATAGSV
ncbi:MAG: NAD(P)H-hydrate dehydratase, partial [Actinobacteria bacterium]|nr:NAD(P)H-hydrate dehydratase [Actinomycetota bacterium]